MPLPPAPPRPVKVAYLTPLNVADRARWGDEEQRPLNLARRLVHGAGPACWQVEVLAFGPEPRREALGPGVTLRVLPAGPGGQGVSWDLPLALAEADLVHVFQPFSRTGEVGLLSARLLGKPVCASPRGQATSQLGASLGCLALVDRLVDSSLAGPQLQAVYEEVLAAEKQHENPRPEQPVPAGFPGRL